ncbi:MAG: Ig-like domain-containing protein [Planctomycetota bacterium]
MRSIRFLAPLVVVLAACGGGGSEAPPVAFEVASSIPENGESNVGLNTEILVFFTRDVDFASVTPTSFRVTSNTGIVIAGQRSIHVLDGKRVRFQPEFGYVASASHTVTVTSDVRDTDGQPLQTQFTMSFQARDPGPELPTQTDVENLGEVLNHGRYLHGATRFGASNVLVAGGYVMAGSVTDIAENLVTSQLTSFVVTNRMKQARAAHVQVALADGRILIAGGESNDNPFLALSSAEIFDPTDLSFTLVAQMNQARTFAHGTLLDDGRVLVTGGQFDDGSGGFGGTRDTAEIYDPDDDTWTLVANAMSDARAGQFTATLLDGDVVIFGGVNGAASGELFDSQSELFAPAIDAPPAPHQFCAGTVLSDGTALCVGGLGSRSVTLYRLGSGYLNALNSMSVERAFHTVTAFEDDRVVIAGGFSQGLVRNTVDIFLPGGLTGQVFRANILLPEPTSHHAAVRDHLDRIWLLGGLPLDAQLPGLRQAVLIKPGEK